MSVRPITARKCKDCGAAFSAAWASYCLKCRHDRKSRPSKRRIYFPTPEQDDFLRQHYDSRVRGRAKVLADKLKFPLWYVKKRAAALGLSHMTTGDRMPWTAEEKALLAEWAGRRTLAHIRKRWLPNRTLTSLSMQCRHMGLSQRVAIDGYTLRDLEQALGHGHRQIFRWVREGRLKAKREGAMHLESYIFTAQAVLNFVRENPSAFRLDRVDQIWFLDLVFGTKGLGSQAQKEAQAA